MSIVYDPSTPVFIMQAEDRTYIAYLYNLKEHNWISVTDFYKDLCELIQELRKQGYRPALLHWID